MTDNKIIEAYHNPLIGLISVSKLAQKLKLKKKYVHDVLKNQEQYQVEKVYKYNPNDNIPILSNPRSYQADLMFFDKMSRTNNGITCLLTIINICTRKAYVYPLKTKEKLEVSNVFNKFLHDINNNISLLTTDNGPEFKNNIMSSICSKHNIRQYFGFAGDHRVTGRIERFNRTLRSLIDRYMNLYNTTKYNDVLPLLVENYNDTPNSALFNESPNKITDETIVRVLMDEKVEYDKLYSKINKYNIGDTVRHLEKKNLFEKGDVKYSRDVCKITEKKGNSYYLDDEKTPYRYYELAKVGEVHKFIKPEVLTNIETTPNTFKELVHQLKIEHKVGKELKLLDTIPDKKLRDYKDEITQALEKNEGRMTRQNIRDVQQKQLDEQIAMKRQTRSQTKK